MRGADEQPGSMFSYVSLEERVPAGPSVARDSPDHRSGAGAAVAALRRAVREFRPAVDSAGEAAAGAAAAGAVHDSQRAAADGATGLQPAVSLVRGPRHGRRGVVADDVYQESRSAARRRHRRGVLRGGVDPCRHRAAAVGRALHGRWHAAGGLGESEEFPAARPGSAGARRRQSDRQFSSAAPHAMRRISRRPIPMRGCTRKPAGAKRGSATWAMC